MPLGQQESVMTQAPDSRIHKDIPVFFVPFGQDLTLPPGPAMVGDGIDPAIIAEGDNNILVKCSVSSTNVPVFEGQGDDITLTIAASGSLHFHQGTATNGQAILLDPAADDSTIINKGEIDSDLTGVKADGDRISITNIGVITAGRDGIYISGV